jgi:hypothetical protein
MFVPFSGKCPIKAPCSLHRHAARSYQLQGGKVITPLSYKATVILPTLVPEPCTALGNSHLVQEKDKPGSDHTPRPEVHTVISVSLKPTVDASFKLTD